MTESKGPLWNLCSGETRAVIRHIISLQSPFPSPGNGEEAEIARKFELRREAALRKSSANQMLEI